MRNRTQPEPSESRAQPEPAEAAALESRGLFRSGPGAERRGKGGLAFRLGSVINGS